MKSAVLQQPVKGSKLYKNFYVHDDHLKIQSILSANRGCRWIVSYDDVPAIRAMYDGENPILYLLGYSAGQKGVGREVIYFSDAVKAPTFPAFDRFAA